MRICYKLHTFSSFICEPVTIIPTEFGQVSGEVTYTEATATWYLVFINAYDKYLSQTCNFRYSSYLCLSLGQCLMDSLCLIMNRSVNVLGLGGEGIYKAFTHIYIYFKNHLFTLLSLPFHNFQNVLSLSLIQVIIRLH